MYKVMNNGCEIPMVGLGCFRAGEESCGDGNLRGYCAYPDAATEKQ